MESSLHSDDSIVQDCAPIFDQQFDEEYIGQIKDKLKYTIGETKPYYTNYERCCRVLENGIPAIKFNFTNEKIKHVTIRLVKNRTALEYVTEEPATSFCAKVFCQKSKVPMSTFSGLIYGGSTMSFGRHKKRLMD